MSDSDRAKWDRRYAAPGLQMGERAKPVLRDWAHHLPRAGAALDLACGEGQAALLLARRGLAVDAVDVSRVALAKARAHADEAGPELSARIRLIAWDLDEGLPPECGGPYAVLTAIHFRDPALLTAAIEGHLSHGGWLLTEVLAAAPDADPHPFRAPPGELLDLARATALQVQAHAVVQTDHGAVARLLARRPAAGTVAP